MPFQLTFLSQSAIVVWCFDGAFVLSLSVLNFLLVYWLCLWCWDCVKSLFFLHTRLQTGGIMYGDVRPGICSSITVFRAFLIHSLTYKLNFCVWLYFKGYKIKFECHQFPSIFEGVMPHVNSNYCKNTVFRSFLLHAFDKLSWNFVYNFVIMQVSSISNVITFCQFL